MGDQLALYKNRVGELEEELQRVSEEKTDGLYEIRRITNDKDKLEQEMKKLQSENIKN